MPRTVYQQRWHVQLKPRAAWIKLSEFIFMYTGQLVLKQVNAAGLDSYTYSSPD